MISERKTPRRWRRAAVLAMVVATAAALGTAAYLKFGADAARVDMPQAPSDADARLRRLVVGVWHDEYQGKRTMTLNADGSGTMLVELSGWRAALSAARLRFDMSWSIEGGRLNKRTVGGEPEKQVQMILRTMGDRVSEPILELTPERLLLLDQDGKTKYDWRRANQ